MTDDELKAIREENERRHGFAPKGMPSYAARTIKRMEDGSLWCPVPWDDHAKAAKSIDALLAWGDALLAEVDRLRAENAELRRKWMGALPPAEGYG